MATDNRHRPGPPFRCPSCRASDQALIQEGEIHVPGPGWGGKPGSAFAYGRRRRRNWVQLRCKHCGRTWRSHHPQALRRAEEAVRRQREQGRGGL